MLKVVFIIIILYQVFYYIIPSILLYYTKFVYMKYSIELMLKIFFILYHTKYWIELIWSTELIKFAHNHIGFYGTVHGDAVHQTLYSLDF